MVRDTARADGRRAHSTGFRASAVRCRRAASDFSVSGGGYRHCWPGAWGHLVSVLRVIQTWHEGGMVPLHRVEGAYTDEKIHTFGVGGGIVPLRVERVYTEKK